MMKRLLLQRETVLLIVLLVLFAGFALTVDGFADSKNILRRSRYWVAPGMIAVPMTFIIATAGIDLSVGAMVALCGITLGMLFNDAGWPIWAAVVTSVLAGTAAGAINGGVSSYLRVPPLVVTLATMALYRGAAMGLSEARALGGFPDGFKFLGGGNLLEPFAKDGTPYLPAPLLALAITMLAGVILLRRTWIGRFTECIGENETAAQFAAINTRALKFWLYTACGCVCGLAALFHTALYASAKADTARGMELEVIACVVIGGTRISGGDASVWGSLLGLLIIGILKYGLEMAGIRSQHIIIIMGILLIATAVFNERMAARGGLGR